jgi:hypothetical protein
MILLVASSLIAWLLLLPLPLSAATATTQRSTKA